MGERTIMDYKLDWNKFIDFEENEPKLSVPFSLDTTYLKRDFTLDIVVWNLKTENLEQTKKVVHYILTNFNRLFETAWTAHYYWYFEQIQCTLSEFFQMICFDSPYYSIRVELNSDYLTDGIARYHFVVNTDYTLSEDNVRLYMRDNKCCACDTNNDDTAILVSANFEDIINPKVAEAVRKSFEKQYEKMEQEQILLAPSFCE